MTKEIEVNFKGPPVGITDLLDFEITEKLKAEAEDRKAGKVKYYPLRPSSAGHCSRKLALELMEYRGKAFYNKPLIEPHVDRLFSLGHAVEWSVLKKLELVSMFQQKYQQQTLHLFTIERPGFEDEICEGSCDSVLFSKDYRGVIDVKSKKDGWSVAFKSKWDELLDNLSHFESLQKVSDQCFYAEDLTALIEELNGDWIVDNLLQLNLYANSEFLRDRGIDFAGLVYYNKNDSRMFELRFNPSKEKFNYVKEKYTKIAKIVDSDEIEKTVCEFPVGSIRYAFCDCHKMLPYSDQDPIKTYFRTLPKKIWPKKVSELKGKDKKEISTLYKEFQKASKASEKLKRIEEKILQILLNQKIAKIEFDDGAVYEVKFLKTPREHYELRRSKQ